MVDVGRLNKRIMIKRYTETENDYGQTVQGLEDFKTIWASVEPTKSDEIKDANRLNNIEYYTIYVRYLAGKDITGEMFINYKGKKIEIIAPPINLMEQNEMIKIFCKHKAGEVFE